MSDGFKLVFRSDVHVGVFLRLNQIPKLFVVSPIIARLGMMMMMMMMMTKMMTTREPDLVFRCFSLPPFGVVVLADDDDVGSGDNNILLREREREKSV